MQDYAPSTVEIIMAKKQQNIEQVQWGNQELPGLDDEKLFGTNWSRIAGIQARSENEEWRNNVVQSNKKKAQDPNWLEKNAVSNKKKAQDPEWLDSVIKANKQRGASPEFLEKIKIQAKKMVENPKWMEDHKLRIEKRSNNPKWVENNKNVLAKARENIKKPIKTPYGVFDCIKNAERTIGINRSTIYSRMKNKSTEYYYITREEYEQLKGKQ